MLVLKRTSKLGKAQLARTGTTVVGNRLADPRSAGDRATHADALGTFAVGDIVRVVLGDYRGRVGTVGWTGQGRNGQRLGIRLTTGPDMTFVDAADVDPAVAPRRAP